MRRLLLVACVATLASCQTTADAATPYDRQVISRMQVLWKRLSSERMDLLTVGTARVAFKVAPPGRVYDIAVVSNTGNANLAHTAKQVVREAAIPPMPPATIAQLEDGHIPGDVTFTVEPAP